VRPVYGPADHSADEHERSGKCSVKIRHQPFDLLLRERRNEPESKASAWLIKGGKTLPIVSA